MRKSSYLQEFNHKLPECKTETDITALCIWICECYGFNYFALRANFPVFGKSLYLNQTPHRWLQHYRDHNYRDFDPVIQHCLKHSTPIVWDEIDIPSGNAGKMQSIVRQHAIDNGILNGFSIPTHGPGSELSIFSLSYRDDKPEILDTNSQELIYFGYSLHQQVKTILHNNSDSSDATQRLTNREKECLHWIAHGKTSWEIARILDVAESTVTYHIRNAAEKLQASNRTEAVFRALSQAEISVY